MHYSYDSTPHAVFRRFPWKIFSAATKEEAIYPLGVYRNI